LQRDGRAHEGDDAEDIFACSCTPAKETTNSNR
jgi:hypothetical protein